MATNLFERGEQAPAPPSRGTGLIVLVGAELPALTRDELTAVGRWRRLLRRRRIGDLPDTAGRSRRLPARRPGRHRNRSNWRCRRGSAAISLHPWFSPDECDQPSALDLTVDVGAGEAVLVLVYTTDGTSLERRRRFPVAGVT